MLTDIIILLQFIVSLKEEKHGNYRNIKSSNIRLLKVVTAWLPISSTGHMIIVELSNMSEEFKEMFLIVIQLGAIMAVVLLYFISNPFHHQIEKENGYMDLV